jgi:hypothetical protein
VRKSAHLTSKTVELDLDGDDDRFSLTSINEGDAEMLDAGDLMS